jgi:hypothetical protein
MALVGLLDQLSSLLTTNNTADITLDNPELNNIIKSITRMRATDYNDDISESFTEYDVDDTSICSPIILCDTEDKVDLILVSNTVSCSRSLLISSAPYFRALLDGHFAEAKQDAIELHNDNAEAMIVLLRSLHKGPNDAPILEQTIEELCSLAKVCDKYGIAKPIAPLVEQRLDTLGLLPGSSPIPYVGLFDADIPGDDPHAPFKQTVDPSHPFSILGDCPETENVLLHYKELWTICFAFKLDKQLWLLFKILIFNLSDNSGHWKVNGKPFPYNFPLAFKRYLSQPNPILGTNIDL